MTKKRGTPVVTVIKSRRKLVQLTPEQKERIRITRQRDSKPDAERVPVSPDPDSIRAAWQEIWQSRLDLNDPRGLILDGKPISLDDLMILTNTYRKQWSMPQVGKNPKWFV